MSEYLCKDCKHSFRPIGRILAFGFNSPHTFMCRKSYTEDHYEPDKVLGKKFVKGGYDPCTLARLTYDDRCGDKARWWQPKEKRDLFKLIVKEAD